MPTSHSKKASTPNQAKKKPKQKRSLKKPGHVRKTAFESDLLSFDIDRAALYRVFYGLHHGQIDNPQQALERVYGIVLESIERAFQSGILKGLGRMVSGAPLLGQLVSSGHEIVDVLKKYLSESVDDVRKKVSHQLNEQVLLVNAKAAAESGARTEMDVCAEMQARTAISKHALSAHRLEELSHSMHGSGENADNETSDDAYLPEMYHVSIDSKEIGLDGFESILEDGIGGVQAEIQQIERWIASGNLSGEQVIEAVAAYLSESADIVALASELTDIVEKLADMIVESIVDGYVGEPVAPNLSEALRDDPRLQEDGELQAFIHSLETNEPDNSEDGQMQEEIDDDALASVIGDVLKQFDL